MMIKWLEDITNQIIEKNKGREIINCQCGISTTGIAHLGNFRELIITYLVAERLKQKGLKSKCILSFDDYDRFKKVPFGIDESYKKYIGMPNFSFPSHIDSNIGYARYYENIIIDELNLLGIDMNYIYQSEKYINNDYIEYIELVLNKREEIFDIVKKYKTQELTDEDKKRFYPIKVYCTCCNKDSTTILDYQKEQKFLTYECQCGFHETNTIDKLRIKMKFNVEWPMRWNYEHVSFEPCGKGHAEELGVLNIAREINKSIYKKGNPFIITYEFLNLKGNKGRMNKNSKELIRVSDVLKVMSKEMLLYFFLKFDPSKEMSISLHDDIPKLYEEFENFVNSSNNIDEKALLKIENKETLKFSDLIKYLPIVNFNVEGLKKYIDFEDNEHNRHKITCATNWLNTYCNNKYWALNNTFNKKYYNSISEERKENLKNFVKLIKLYKSFDSYDEFFNKFKESVGNIKLFYEDFYNMVFNTSKGIPLKKIFENYDLTKIQELLTEKTIDKKTDTSRIIHLSDLHFDILDNQEDLASKWEQLVDFLKKGNYINYLFLSGDIIYYKNAQQNYEIAYKYLNYLMDELRISKDSTLVCTGNHDMIAFDNFSNNYYKEFNKNIRDHLMYYNQFLKRLVDMDINDSNDLYYLRQFANFDAFVVNTLFCLANDDAIFYQNIDIINDLMMNYQKGKDKFCLLLSHTPYSFNKELFDRTLLSNNFKYNLCGHYHDKDIIYNENGTIDLVSGSTNGFLSDDSKYNIYEIKDKIIMKKLIYKNKWFNRKMGEIDK